MFKLILASASPRRRELLKQAGYDFEVHAPSFSEAPQDGEDAIQRASRLARGKAEAVFSVLQSSGDDPQELLVLGADTVVECDGELLGKPISEADAARMLRLLSGRTHQVVTGIAIAAGIVSPPYVEVAAEVTYVTMRDLSPQEIFGYVASGEPMDKAGAYAIQGHAGRWIPRINGCYFNVVGLPLALTSHLLDAVTRLQEPI